MITWAFYTITKVVMKDKANNALWKLSRKGFFQNLFHSQILNVNMVTFKYDNIMIKNIPFLNLCVYKLQLQVKRAILLLKNNNIITYNCLLSFEKYLFDKVGEVVFKTHLIYLIIDFIWDSLNSTNKGQTITGIIL